MNPSTMQNMMGLRGNGMGFQQGNGMSEGNPNQQIQRAIYQHISREPTQSGWWSSVSLQARTGIIFHIVSSLRLIKPEMSPQQAIEVAIRFERKAFEESQDKGSYEEACRAKLTAITDTRAQQAIGLQQRIQNYGGPPMQLLQQQQQQQQQQLAMSNALASMQMQGQLPQGFQGLQQQMQPPHMQMQPTVPQPYSSNNVKTNQPSMQPGQHMQPNSSLPGRPGHPQFSPEESRQISELAQRNAQTASQEEVEMIKQKMNGIDMNTRKAWAQQGLEPYQMYFRQQAMKQFMSAKARAREQMQGSMAQAGGFNPQQSQPISRNPSSNPNQQPGGTAMQANFDQSFTPNIQQNMHQQIRGLQQDALRKQDLGREVVPASNSQQQNPQSRGFQNTPRQIPIQQPAANRSVPTPNAAQQQNLQAQQLQNEKMQAARVVQAAMGSQAPLGQQTPLQGQRGGLSGQTGQGISQPSPSMPNLNRGMQSTPQQPAKQDTPIIRPPQGPQDQGQGFETPSSQQAQAKQQQSSVSGNSLMNGGQLGNIKLSTLSPALQAKLNTLPENRRRSFLAQYIQRYQQMQQQQQQQRNLMAANSQVSGPQGVSPVPGQVMQPGRPQQPPSQQVNPGMFGQQPDMQMPLQPGQGMQQRSLIVMPNQFVNQFQGQGQQFRDMMQIPANLIQTRTPPLTEEQAAQMANEAYPPGILNSQLVGAHLPHEIKNWSQLLDWAARNRHIIPQDVLPKLHGLQSLHYHQRMQSNTNDMSIRQGQEMATARSTPQPGPAPQAQMTQMNTPQQFRPNGLAGNPLQIPQPGRIPQLQQPSMQDIQMARQKLPEHMRSLPNDQVARLIMTRRMQLMNQRPMNPQFAQQLNDQQRRFLEMQANQSSQASLNGKLNQPVSTTQQNLRKANPMPTPNRPSQGQSARPGQPIVNQMQLNQKNLKRSSTDEVIEVPNPKIAQQEQRNQAPGKLGHSKQPPSQSDVTAEQANQGLQNREGQYESELRTQAALRDQSRPQQQLNGISEEERRKQRLRQISNEVMQTLQARSRPPIAVDQATRDKMAKIVQDNQQLYMRDDSLYIFMRHGGDEKLVRELVATRYIILQQIVDKSFNLKDQVTISLEDLEKGTTRLKNFFLYLMDMVKKLKSNGASTSNEPPGPTGTTTTAPMLPLNAANLRVNQQAELMKSQAARHNSSQVQRSNNSRDNKAPPPPTSAQPPFSFLGAQSPHGVPLYGPNELTQDKLKFPPTKRRKGNPGSAVSTPVQTHATPASGPSPQISKVPSPQVSRQNIANNKTKCQAPQCKHSTQEYDNAEDLHKHTMDVHEVTEPVIEDPLAWALESIRFGLGLDENGKIRSHPRKSETEKVEQAQAMKKTASTQSQTPLRQEGSTPMSRATTQNGRLDPSDLLKTSQHGSGASKSGKTTDPKASSSIKENTVMHGPITPPHDPWSDCPVSQAEISALLPTLEELHSSLNTASLTPPSTVSSSKSEKNSPRPSDIGEDDNLKIQLHVGDSWIAPGLYDNALFPPSNPSIEDDDILGMDWETAFGTKGANKVGDWGGFDPSLFSLDIQRLEDSEGLECR